MNIFDYIFPKRCVGCGKIGKYFCDVCRVGIRPIAQNEKICPMCGRLALDGVTHPRCRTRYCLDGLTSFFHYNSVVQKAIKSIKYRLVFDLAKEFMSFIEVPEFKNYILIPIPLHPKRLRERGFNQTEVLARELHIPMRIDILRRTKQTKPQAEIKRKERLKNMQNVFIADTLKHRHIDTVLLFDDVFTTGATMRSAATALKQAGVKKVWAMTIAR